LCFLKDNLIEGYKMEKDFLDIVFKFLKIAGKIAIKGQVNLKANLKADNSIVTETDLIISKKFHEIIKEISNSGEHVILDEENLPDINNFFGKKIKFLWTLDPIDGTTTYFHGFPLWAIGVSLYKDFKPYISAIYVPSMGELIYTDSKKSYHLANVFKKNEQKKEITLNKKELTPKSVILQHKLEVKETERKTYTLLDLYSSYILGFYTILGRSNGAFFNKPMKLWDITATLPIALNLKMRFTDVNSGKEVIQLSSDLIDDDWYLKSTYLMCQDCDFDKIAKVYLLR
jgi:fructose-1,6-bisphosphatase/inositol monophosphatase family enzyme